MYDAGSKVNLIQLLSKNSQNPFNSRWWFIFPFPFGRFWWSLTWSDCRHRSCVTLWSRHRLMRRRRCLRREKQTEKGNNRTDSPRRIAARSDVQRVRWHKFPGRTLPNGTYGLLQPGCCGADARRDANARRDADARRGTTCLHCAKSNGSSRCRGTGTTTPRWAYLQGGVVNPNGLWLGFDLWIF